MKEKFRSDLVDGLRTAPLGVLMIAGLLGILGIGSLAGGMYLLLSNESINPWAAATATAGGPVMLYLTYHLARLAEWTRRTLLVLIGLLLASSVVRLLVSPELPLSATAEILLELGAAYYLTRPSIRAHFREGPQEQRIETAS